MTDEHISRESSTDLVVRPPGAVPASIPEMLEIPLDRIRESRFRHRRDYKENLDSMAESIDKHGVLQAPAVMPVGEGQYELVFGHHRHSCCKRLGHTTMVCRILNITVEKAGILSYRENHDRHDVHPVDRARHLRQLKDMNGWTDAQLAEEIGSTQSSVSEHLGVLDLSPEILEAVENGTENSITFTGAVLLSRLAHSRRPNRDFEISELKNKAVRHGLSAAELKGLVKLFTESEYDRLPETLRIYLLQNKVMTAVIASVYLHPESIVTGNGEQADQLRKIAVSLPPSQMEGVIVRAVRSGASPTRVREQVLALVQKCRSSVTDKTSHTISAYEDVLSDVSRLLNRVGPACNEAIESESDHPERLVSLCHALDQVLIHITPLIQSMKDAIAQTRQEPAK